MHAKVLTLALLASVLNVGCGADRGPDASTTDDGGLPETDGGSLVAAPQLGDGTPGSAHVVSIYSPSAQREATDLEFNPTSGKLWVTFREYESSAICTEASFAGCDALPGWTLEITGAEGDAPSSVLKQDANAWHFMRRPTSIAFGDTDARSSATPGQSSFFATCHEARTGNYDDDAYDYMGPAFWTSDPAVYTFNGPGGNGSHLDMLHSAPFCMGIAHNRGNAFWVFNGDAGSIDDVDFVEPHVAGGEEHGDGRIRRFVAGQVARVANVPSHLAFDSDSAFLYIADTGNARIARLDTATGTMAGRFPKAYDSLEVSNFMSDAVIEDVVPPGTLVQPSGLALHDGTLFVSDHATSIIYAFSVDGALLNQFDTELPEGSLAGLTIGPDNKIYFVNMKTSEVFRLDPAS